MAETKIALSFPAKAEYLLLARLALAGVGRGLGMDDDALADLKLAVTEACGNAVRHAYDAETGTVEVVYVVRDDRIELLVEDRGSGLGDAPADLELPTAADGLEPFEGGLGIAIIRAVVDELDVREGADGRGTVVHMTKYLSGAPV
jgi:serine/threonine-protein kinase RsbW